MQFNQVLSKMSQATFDAEVLQTLATLSKSAQESRRVVDALVENEAWLVSGECAAVSRSMEVLESLADQSESAACILMAHLWAVANALKMHDVCDAIDLWISSCRSPELRQHLQMLAGSQGDANLRRHYEELARQGWD
jgi:hypothetical protein